MTRWQRTACGVLVFVCVAASTLHAQRPEDYYGRTVTEIAFEVAGRSDESPDLAGVVDVRVGQPLTQQAVRASMDHIVGLGRYDDVTPAVRPTPTGVAVVFLLTPRYPVNRVEVTTVEGALSEGTLRDDIRQRFIGSAYGVRTDAVRTFVQQLHVDEGYLNPEVTARITPVPGTSSATLVVTVDPGSLTRITHTEVYGTSLYTPAEVTRRISAAEGQPYRRREIEAGLTRLEDALRARGYYLAEATYEATPLPGGVDLRVNVESGPRVELIVEPQNEIPGEIDVLVPIRREQSADVDLLEDAKANIERALRAQGYLDAVAPFTLVGSDDGSTLTITYSIRRGVRYFVDHVEVPTDLHISAPAIRNLIGTRAGQPYNPNDVTAGLVRIINEYRLMGYYQAKAEPSRQGVPERATNTEAWTILYPNITEGPLGRISAVTFTFEGSHAVPESVLAARMRSKVGEPFIESDAADDRDDLRRYYRDRGFLSSALEIQARSANDGRDVTLAVTINEGPVVVVGRITVVGNEQVSEQEILRDVGLQPGQPLSGTALDEARARLNSRGTFRRVNVTQETPLGGETEAHVIVSIEEVEPRFWAFGGGLEGGSRNRTARDGGPVPEEYIFISPHGSLELTRRNLGGRNRSVSLFTRVSLKPPEVPGDPIRDGRGLSGTEYRVVGTYRELRAFRSDTDLLGGITFEEASRSTFSFRRRGLNAEGLRRMTSRVSVSGRYALTFTQVFNTRIPENGDDQNDQQIIDRLFPQVRLSLVSGSVSWDGRNSPIAPTRGLWMAADLEVAARALFSEVGYVKTFLQSSVFRALDSPAKTVVAVRGQVGLARGFTRTAIDVDGQTVIVRNLPISQRFFSGGGTTVRGFQLDRLGDFNPECLQCSVINPTTGLSSGGNSVVVLNAEIRRYLTQLFGDNLGVVAFLDGGNVFARASDLTLSRIRRTAGFGVRYDSPIGPLRLDFGFKLDRKEIGGRRESGWEYHLSLGEAF